jgi:hypothetical protein
MARILDIRKKIAVGSRHGDIQSETQFRSKVTRRQLP